MLRWKSFHTFDLNSWLWCFENLFLNWAHSATLGEYWMQTWKQVAGLNCEHLTSHSWDVSDWFIYLHVPSKIKHLWTGKIYQSYGSCVIQSHQPANYSKLNIFCTTWPPDNVSQNKRFPDLRHKNTYIDTYKMAGERYPNQLMLFVSPMNHPCFHLELIDPANACRGGERVDVVFGCNFKKITWKKWQASKWANHLPQIIGGWTKKTLNASTPLKTNMSPENWCLEDEFSFQHGPFSGSTS